jgi:iron(III) transport system substrate-binding protein
MKKRIFLSFTVSVVAVGLLLMIATPILAAGKVVVYSTNDQAQNDMMASLFEKTTGIKCEMVRGGSGVNLKRIQAEKGRPLGDVALGFSKIIMLNNMDLWEPYKMKDFGVYPDDYKDAGGMWTGQMLHVMVFAYNKKLVAPGEAPKTWDDFLNPRWKDRVAYCNPNNSGSAYTQLTIMLQLWGDNEAGWKKVEQFLKNAKVTQQSSLVMRGVADGEFAAGITMEYDAFLHKKGGAPVDVVYPAQGTVAYTEAVSIIKGAKNLKEAKAFIDWSSGKPVCEEIIKEFMRRPARPDINFTDLAPGMLSLSELKQVVGYKEDYWTERRPAVLEKVKDILLRVK